MVLQLTEETTIRMRMNGKFNDSYAGIEIVLVIENVL